MIHLTINQKPVAVPEGTTILEAARSAGIEIPSLCYLKNVHRFGSCRICVVEVEGMRTLQASCMTRAREGMVVHTHSARVRARRKVLYELMLSSHSKNCLSCGRNQSCELQALGERLGVTSCRLSGEQPPRHVDVSPAITRDTSKCVLCRRCVTVCRSIQQVGAIAAQNRGFDTVISPAMGLPLNATACAMCGQCTVVCPTGALVETDGLERVWQALSDPQKRVVAQTAPAVRAALGEAFGYPVGACVTGKMAAALHELGFDEVFDTNFAADLTILEEGTELLGRLESALTGGVMEAALRTVCELVTGRELPFENLHVTPIEGLEQIKTASVTLRDTLPAYRHLEGVEVRVAVTSGLAGADRLMREIAKGQSPYHFIEVMGCPGGCVSGGGQPRTDVENFRELRSRALYAEDEGKPLRKSHENPDLLRLYETWLGEVGGPLAHELLHTRYVPRGLYNERVP